MRDVIFPEILADLIDSRGLGRRRKELADAIHVSPGAISQYTAGRNRPSFEVLVRLADYFGVSLDYLIFGTEVVGSSQPPDALLRYFDRALARSHELNLQRASAVVDVGRALSEGIEAAVDHALTDGASVMAGTLADDDTLELEGYATAVSLASMDLAYDVVLADDGRASHGRFLAAVAENLNRGHPYRIVLPPGQDWSNMVRVLRQLLAEQSSGDVVSRHLRVRVARAPFLAGVGIYELDTESLQRRAPTLWLKVRDFVSEGGKLAYTLPPSDTLLADCLFDPGGIPRVLEAFEAHWTEAQKL